MSVCTPTAFRTFSIAPIICCLLSIANSLTHGHYSVNKSPYWNEDIPCKPQISTARTASHFINSNQKSILQAEVKDKAS